MTTHRIWGLKVFGLVVAMLLLLGGWQGSRVAYAQEVEPHFKCYVITPGTALHEPVTLTDQFQEESFVVRAPQLVCTPVLQKCRDSGCVTPTTIQSLFDHLKCYNITSAGPPLQQPATMSDQFNPEEDVTLRTAQYLCVPAKKTLHGG